MSEAEALTKLKPTRLRKVIDDNDENGDDD